MLLPANEMVMLYSAAGDCTPFHDMHNDVCAAILFAQVFWLVLPLLTASTCKRSCSLAMVRGKTRIGQNHDAVCVADSTSCTGMLLCGRQNMDLLSFCLHVYGCQAVQAHTLLCSCIIIGTSVCCFNKASKPAPVVKTNASGSPVQCCGPIQGTLT